MPSWAPERGENKHAGSYLRRFDCSCCMYRKGVPSAPCVLQVSDVNEEAKWGSGLTASLILSLTLMSLTLMQTKDGFVEGGLTQVDFAFDMGYKYGIAVSLDLHAANGSQNGYDHSAPFVSATGHGEQ